MASIHITDHISSKESFQQSFVLSDLPEPILIKPDWSNNNDSMYTDPQVIKWLIDTLSTDEIFLLPNIENSLLTSFNESQKFLSQKPFLLPASSPFSQLPILDLQEDWENESFITGSSIQETINYQLNVETETSLKDFFSKKLWKMRKGTFISFTKLAPNSFTISNLLGLFPSTVITEKENFFSFIVDAAMVVQSIFRETIGIREGVNSLLCQAETGNIMSDGLRYRSRDNKGYLVYGFPLLDVDAVSYRLLGHNPENSELLMYAQEQLGNWDIMNIRRAKMLSLNII